MLVVIEVQAVRGEQLAAKAPATTQSAPHLRFRTILGLCLNTHRVRRRRAAPSRLITPSCSPL